MKLTADLQHSALKAAACDRILTDHGVSGTSASRPEPDKLLNHLQCLLHSTGTSSSPGTRIMSRDFDSKNVWMDLFTDITNQYRSFAREAQCQWPLGTARGWPAEMPAGGHGNCPVMANRSAHQGVGGVGHAELGVGYACIRIAMTTTGNQCAG